jgi:hypothetical protein
VECRIYSKTHHLILNGLADWTGKGTPMIKNEGITPEVDENKEQRFSGPPLSRDVHENK